VTAAVGDALGVAVDELADVAVDASVLDAVAGPAIAVGPADGALRTVGGKRARAARSRVAVVAVDRTAKEGNGDEPKGDEGDDPLHGIPTVATRVPWTIEHGFRARCEVCVPWFTLGTERKSSFLTSMIRS